MVSVKVKLALVLFFVGMVFGALAGYGIFRVPQPVFDLIALLIFIYLGIWAIRKRIEKKRRRASSQGGDGVP